MSNQPVIILREDTERTQGRDARHNNVMAAIVIGDVVKSTLGPRGMDKLLVDSMGDVTITNDGASILKEIDVQHPAAKMLVEVSKSQDQETGDGTTSSVIIAGELLKKAMELMDEGVHPTIIVSGYQKASEISSKILSEISINMDEIDKKVLRKIASTSMNSKSVSVHQKMFADIAVDAVLAIVDESSDKIDIDMIEVIKKNGKSLEETEFVDGIVIDKEIVHASMPRKVSDAKICLLNTAIEVEKTEFDAEIRIDTPNQIQAFLEEEERMLKSMVDKVVESGTNVLICQKGVDDVAQHFLAKHGILTVRRATKSVIEKLSKATGASILSSIDEIDNKSLGYAGKVEEVTVGDNKLLYVRECKNPKAVSIVIRGGTEHIIAEAERALHDALCVVRNVVEDGTYVAGGGSSEIEISKRLRESAEKVGGREQMAIQAFADALMIIPKTLAENGGHDTIDMVTSLNKAHSEENGLWFGVDVINGKVTDMLKMNVVEPSRVKYHAIRSASEASQMILRVDDVIAVKSGCGPDGCAPGGAGMPGMGGGMPGMGMM